MGTVEHLKTELTDAQLADEIRAHVQELTKLMNLCDARNITVSFNISKSPGEKQKFVGVSDVKKVTDL